MAFNFPSSPSTGTTYPIPPVAGQPVYTWDGEKWTGVATTLIASNAPFEAMAYNGLQINGGMEVSQERGTTTTNANGAYLGDVWKHFFSGTMIVDGTVSSPPAGLFSNYGFRSQLQLAPSTAQASLGAGNYDIINHAIEGYRTARLSWGKANAQPITIGFWTGHTRTGVYSVTVRNGSNRSYAFTYTQAVSDVAQYNTATVPGDTTGTWTTDNTAGITLTFANAMGTTGIAPSANTWLAADYLAAPGQINAVAATSDNFRLTGVTVLPGIEAPSAGRSAFIMRPYDQELVTCKRYWESTSGGYRLVMSSTGFGGTHVGWKVEKRATPTLTYPGDGTKSNSTFQSFLGTNVYGAGVQFSGTANTESYNYGFYVNADARL